MAELFKYTRAAIFKQLLPRFILLTGQKKYAFSDKSTDDVMVVVTLPGPLEWSPRGLFFDMGWP